MLVVLDTNVIVSGAMWRGSPATILNAWADNLIEVIASPEILKEYREILLEVGSKVGKKSFAERWVNIINEKVRVVIPEQKVKLCRDPDDDKFLSCALAADAVFLISGDKDLGVLGGIGATLIVTPGQFVRDHLSN